MPEHLTLLCQKRSLMNLSYSSFQANGGIVSMTDNVQNLTYNFGYDTLNRLYTAETSVTHATDPVHCWGEGYGYDRWSNLLSIIGASSAYRGCTQENLSLTMSNNKVTSSGFIYDAAGNLLTDGAHTYQY